ncbi:uncharacterized protein LOC123556863 [Mercenaria mercenaria]|uniref:uncharacterized protein LOC123556863 n=1 Tax=Mercenaria mercenaria TaxID=6596 RepID=UPI00234F4AE2|nr:uncharacterized protein LOC123556863 [Mercenaria mercenaria]
MSLRKEDLDRAKRRANERLTGWVADIKMKDDFGIPKLQREFIHTFKKIEYIPKEILKIEDDKERELQRQREEEEKFKRSRVLDDMSGAGMSTVPPEDVHDSNSSNLSSGLDSTKDELRISESRTPYNKTPLLLGDNTESKDTFVTDTQVVKKSETQTALNNFIQGQRQSRLSIIPGVVPALMTFKRRRVTRRSFLEEKTDSSKIEAVTETEEDQDEKEEIKDHLEISSVPSIVKKSSSVLSSHKASVKPFKASKGPVDLMLRRISRQHRKQVPSKHELPTVKAELTTEEKRQEVLNRFRRCVRLLIHVRVLLNVARLRIQEEEKSKEFKRFDDGMELSFDVTSFKSAVSYSGLTSRAKQALKKIPRDRTEEDAKILMEILIRLPMFMKYSKAVKQALAHLLWYDAFKEGRVIVKQGDPGYRMYFVISGEVDLKRTDYMDTGEQISYHLKTVQTGATFGELALIRNVRREFTAICRGSSEFLSLSKDEFNHALRSRWERECDKRYNFLRTSEHFNVWTDKQLQFCADSSELKEYMDNNVILGDIDGATDSVYFITKGRCEIVRRLVLVRHQSPYQRPNILLPLAAKRRPDFLNKSYCRNRRINSEEIRFLTVTSLHPGNYFGVGENLRDTYILARGKTELLVINSAQFSIQGKSEQLRRMKRERENTLPSNKSLYEKFQQNRKWFEYRNKLLKDILRQKTLPFTGSLLDVPKSILGDPTIPKDLIFYNKRYC